MVHLRLNDPDSSRNKYINYITALPQYHDHSEARHRLLQLAAQVQPVMKSHGFQVNSLEEYEWNREFAGRNWNNGETVELVLRRQDGSFAPLQWVLMVFCHELAHIKYMNHIPSQHGKLDRALRQECRDLQSRGYFGDGFWSAGQRLQDNAFVAGISTESLRGLPEYSCGGAFKKAPKGGSKKRRRRLPGKGSAKRGFSGPNLHTGAQTAPSLTRSRRVQADMPGQGSRVDNLNFLPKASASSHSYKNDPNSTFRKRTQSAAARELRAQAALRRFESTKPNAKVLRNCGDHQYSKVDAKKEGSGPLDSFVDPSWNAGLDTHSPSFGSNPSQEPLPISERSTTDLDRSNASPSDPETESETEEEDSDPEGGLIIRIRDYDGNVVDKDNEVDVEGRSMGKDREISQDGQRLPEEAGSNPNGVFKVKPEPVRGQFSTQASTESAEQRHERARLYRQHEQRQGGHSKSTAEEWQELCNLPPSATSPVKDKVVLTIPPSIGDGKRIIDSSAPKTASKNSSSKSNKDFPIEILSSDDEHDDPKARSTAPHASANSRRWTCQVCTLLNVPESLRCEACLTTRGSFLVGQ